MIRSLGNVLHREREAEDLLESLEPLRLMRKADCKKRAVYLIWKDPWMAAGGDTFISDMMRCAGLSNALGDRKRYPALSIGDIVSLKPDLLLLSSEPYPFRERHMTELKELMPDAKTVLVDGEMFSWYGSRMVSSIPYLRELKRGFESGAEGSDA
jgi:ABC-type Fe3+-hydroxamate transport system substrate-binding protein